MSAFDMKAIKAILLMLAGALITWPTAPGVHAAENDTASERGIDARMLRYPDVSASQIVFCYAGDIWLAPKTGGLAQRLSSPRGEEIFPRFSPDGSQIAFSGNYDGNLDIYVVPT